jgi:hypothetical protein
MHAGRQIFHYYFSWIYRQTWVVTDNISSPSSSSSPPHTKYSWAEGRDEYNNKKSDEKVNSRTSPILLPPLRLQFDVKASKMKFLTALLICSSALLCISEVASSPIQINNNNMGDVTSIKIDINGEIHNVVNVVSVLWGQKRKLRLEKLRAKNSLPKNSKLMF